MLDDNIIAGSTGATDASLVSIRSANDAYPLLRQLGGKAYQLHAAARAADHFLGQDNAADRDTGAWLISSAFSIAEELAAGLDGLAKVLRDRPGDVAFSRTLRPLRTRAHQLHAATRAADHFLEQDSRDDRNTGSWLIAYALGTADTLASQLDDLASSLKQSANEAVPTYADVTPGRRSSAGFGLRDVSA